ncbi:hypothetical protein [Maribacter antarcticus]|uniref:hypothetical protein n=1 Tax=Maribacter antarcticus TaxID=505250 RepID=UPI000ACA681C|nr:hypothetical protein [Maribacter antarcticus]
MALALQRSAQVAFRIVKIANGKGVKIPYHKTGTSGLFYAKFNALGRRITSQNL